MRYKHLMLNSFKSTLFFLFENLALVPIMMQTAVTSHFLGCVVEIVPCHAYLLV